MVFAGLIGLCLVATGCQTQTGPTSIVGTWECTNFKAVSHVSQFKESIVKFGNDGLCTSHFVNDAGERIDQPSYRYHFDGVNMWNEQHTNTVWKVSIHGDRMDITTVRDPNQDNVGFTLKHRRLKE